MFMGGYLADGVTPNEWWFDPSPAQVTSMLNGEDVTLTASFDPSQWSNYYGHIGNENAAVTAEFYDALSGVTRLGLSFGSGYFYSDGFGFNTGGTAFLELDSINPTGGTPTPEPTTMVILAGGLGVIALVRRRRARF
jgi:hypothetical protein